MRNRTDTLSWRCSVSRLAVIRNGYDGSVLAQPRLRARRERFSEVVHALSNHETHFSPRFTSKLFPPSR